MTTKPVNYERKPGVKRTRSNMSWALAQILEVAKVNRDFANTDLEQARWSHVANLCAKGLGDPSIADLEAILTKAREAL